MVATGKTCPAYLPPYSTVYWHYKQWRQAGATLETNERPTWASARTGEKKAKWTTLIIIDFTCREKYL